VVAVGLNVIVPLTAVDAKFPGVTVTLVAPEAAQFNVVLVPATISAGLAEKDVIDGAATCGMVGKGVVQPVTPTQARRTANRTRPSAPVLPCASVR
jgi:hypothetical protein